MATTTYYDDLIRDYLLYRGFTSTLKAFDAELKSDKDKGFRADKIVDQLCSYIASYDLTSLRECWSHLDQRVFSRLEHQFLPAVRKLESGLLKMYVMNAVQTNRHDKLTEFFEKLTPELQNQPEWKEWFVLPFVKNPEENPVFAMFFTRQWQDTMLVSLHNFLSVIFQYMPLPTLLNYEEEHVRIAHLMEENEILKQKLSTLQGKDKHDGSNSNLDVENSAATQSTELMDDFYVIAQEAPPADSHGKSIRSLIRNISSGLPTSPILGRKQSQNQQTTTVVRKPSEEPSQDCKYIITRSKPRTASVPPLQSTMTTTQGRSRPPSESEVVTYRKKSSGPSKDETQHQFSKASSDSSQQDKGGASGGQTVKSDVVSHAHTRTNEESDSKAPFILLSQEEYREHHSAVTHCKFNALGSVIASSDINGVIKIWSPSPSPQTIATVISKSSVLALEWANKLERLLLLGNKTGTIRLYDTKDKKTLCEVGLDSNATYKDQRITCLSSSPTQSSFICCSQGRRRIPLVPSADPPANPPEGRIMIWDMKSMKFEKNLTLEPASFLVSCCVFNHNGQLLLVGAADGRIRLFDMRCHEMLATWQGHQGNAHSVQFSSDETSCYSLGEDGNFIQWSINKTGQKMWNAPLHENSAGPFVIPASGLSSRTIIHRPVGKLFASDAEGRHILTCAPGGGIIYSTTPDEGLQRVMALGGHKTPVITVDWATALDCGTCITASVDGEIKISTLLTQQ